MDLESSSKRKPLLRAGTAAPRAGSGSLAPPPVKYQRSHTMGSGRDKKLQEYRDSHEITVASFSAIGRVSTVAGVKSVAPRLARLSKQASIAAGYLIAPAPIKEEEEDHPEGLQSNGEATVNLLNNCLGSGMLTMGFAISKAGVIPSIAMMLVSAVLNRYTLLLNLESCKIAECDAASAALGGKAFGAVGRAGLVVVYTIFAFLCCVSYVTATADSLTGLAALFGATPAKIPLQIGAWAVLLLPTTLVRSLKAVAALSFVAFIGGVAMLMAVSIYCIQHLVSTGFPALNEIAWFSPSLADFLTAMPILLLVFSVQPGGGTVLATMQDTSDENIKAVSRNAYALVFGMDLCIGAITYVTFLSEVEGNVLLNFSATSIIAVIARVALLDLVVLSYMIMMIPCKLSLIELLFEKNEARMEASASQFYGITGVLNLLAVGAAVGIPDLSVVNGLNGAVCTNLVAFILPIFFYLKVRADDEAAPSPVCSLASLPFAAICVFGLFSLLLGSVQLAQTLA